VRHARRRDPRPVRLSPEDIAFLDGYLSFYDELPDGAWQAACEEAIGRCEEFRGADPYEVWLAWFLASAKKDRP
jgi:hypothetical protein